MDEEKIRPSNRLLGDYLEVPAFETLSEIITKTLGVPATSNHTKRLPYIRAKVDWNTDLSYGYEGYTLIWTRPLTRKTKKNRLRIIASSRSQPDFTLSKTRGKEPYRYPSKSILALEAKNHNKDFLISSRWHRENTELRFLTNNAKLNILLTSYYNLSPPSEQHILESLYIQQITTLTLGHQILTPNDPSLKPTLHKMLDKTLTEAIIEAQQPEPEPVNPIKEKWGPWGL